MIRVGLRNSEAASISEQQETMLPDTVTENICCRIIIESCYFPSTLQKAIAKCDIEILNGAETNPF